MEPFMTSEEIAELLHVDPVTIRRLVNKGELSAYRIGADYRFAPSDLQDYLQRQRIVAHAQKEQGMNPNQPHDQFVPLEQFAHLFRQVFQAQRTLSSAMDRFDKFTEKARRALALAQEEAQRFKHNYIGTEHLLLGLIREKEGVAAQVLNNLGVELDQIRHAVETIMGQGDHIVQGEIGLTPRAKMVIQLAVKEAQGLNHHYIGTEHILLGLIREGQGIAAKVLESSGLQLERVREETLQVLRQHGQIQEEGPTVIPQVPAEASSLLAEGESGLLCATCGAHSPRYFRYCFNCGRPLVHE
jgi:excisionase family DNA binding protein